MCIRDSQGSGQSSNEDSVHSSVAIPNGQDSDSKGGPLSLQKEVGETDDDEDDTDHHDSDSDSKGEYTPLQEGKKVKIHPSRRGRGSGTVSSYPGRIGPPKAQMKGMG